MSEDGRSPSDMSPSGEATKATIAKFLMAAIGFAGNIYFARVLGPERIGGFYLLVAVTRFLGRPMTGINKAVVKRASEASTSIDQSVGALGTIGVGWFTIVAAGTVAARDPLVAYVGIESAATLLVLYFASEILYGTFVPVLQAKGKVGFAYGMDAFRSYVEIPVQFALVVLGFGVNGLIAGLVTANLIATPVALRGLGSLPERPSRELLSRIGEYAKFSVPDAIVGTAYGRFDTFLLGALLSQTVVGDYGVAARLTMPALFVASSVSATTLVRISGEHSRGTGVSADVTNALSFSAVLSVPIFFGGVILAEPLITVVYGTAYTGAAAFLLVLGVQRVFESQTKVLLEVINGIDRPDYTLRLSALALAVNIPLGVLLVREIGGIGVVIATVFAETIRYGGGWLLVRRAIPDANLLTRTFLEQLVSGAIMAGVVLLAVRTVPADTIASLIAVVALGGMIYASTLLLISARVRTTTAEVWRLTIDRVERAR